MTRIFACAGIPPLQEDHAGPYGALFARPLLGSVPLPTVAPCTQPHTLRDHFQVLTQNKRLLRYEYHGREPRLRAPSICTNTPPPQHGVEDECGQEGVRAQPKYHVQVSCFRSNTHITSVRQSTSPMNIRILRCQHEQTGAPPAPGEKSFGVNGTNKALTAKTPKTSLHYTPAIIGRLIHARGA